MSWTADFGDNAAPSAGGNTWARGAQAHGTTLAPQMMLHIRGLPGGEVKSLTVAETRAAIKNMGGEHDHISDQEGLKQAYLQCVATQQYHESQRQQHAGRTNNPDFLGELANRGVKR